jgi:hypothetical protein
MSNCGFSLLQAAMFKLSPQLGGDGCHTIGSIKQFAPQDGKAATGKMRVSVKA